MPQSLASIHIHLVFSTKDRRPMLADEFRSDLHAYMAAVLKNLGCPALLINSVEDHAHILFRLGRTTMIAKAVEEVKKSSSKWIKPRAAHLADFAWQGGYGAFSVSASKIDATKAYIANQREHHARQSFQDELRTILKRHDVEFDERYLWD